MMKKIVFSSVVPLLLLAGCWILPGGDPPAGNITNNPARTAQQIKTEAQAMDYLVSSLTVALLSNCPGKRIRLDSDASSSRFSAKVLRESGKISGNTVTYTDSGWVLKSILEKGILQLELLRNGKAVWSETLEYSFAPSLQN